MVHLRAPKVEAVVQEVPDVVPAGDPEGDLLMVAGAPPTARSTWPCAPSREGTQDRPRAPAPPEPAAEEPGDVLKRYKKSAGPERNWASSCGSPGKYLVDAQASTKVQGKPLQAV